jgi:hypothetical protein
MHLIHDVILPGHLVSRRISAGENFIKGIAAQKDIYKSNISEN